MKVKMRVGDKDVPIDVSQISMSAHAEPLWSDGTFDGTHIPKIVGYAVGKKRHEAILASGEKIAFDKCVVSKNDVLTILPPYTVVTA